MSRKWFVFVECNTTGTARQLVHAAKEEGFEPVVLAVDPSRYPFVRDDVIATIVVDTTNPELVYEACHLLRQRGEIAAVMSNSDYFLEVAALVATKLGLPCSTPNAIRICRNKHSQRRRLSESDIAMPDYCVVNSVTSAVAAAESLSLPVVLKPVYGGGSVGVRQCEHIADVAAHASFLVNRTINERGLPNPPDLLVETVAVGPEFSVETFGTRVIGVTAKHLGNLPYSVEVGHDVPSGTGAHDTNQIADIAAASLRALGLEWGPAHTEVRMTRDGARVIEVNPRLAGGFIPDLYRLAFGFDLVRATVRAAVGRQPVLQGTHRRAAAVRFLLPAQEGQLRDIQGLTNAERVPGVQEVRLYRRSGDRILLHGDLRDRIGHVIAAADTLEEVREAAERARLEISFKIDATIVE